MKNTYSHKARNIDCLDLCRNILLTPALNKRKTMYFTSHAGQWVWKTWAGLLQPLVLSKVINLDKSHNLFGFLSSFPCFFPPCFSSPPSLPAFLLY